jgi:hypothetical protein
MKQVTGTAWIGTLATIVLGPAAPRFVIVSGCLYRETVTQRTAPLNHLTELERTDGRLFPRWKSPARIPTGVPTMGRVGRLQVTGRVIPTILAAAALFGCAMQGTTAVEEPIWLEYADSQVVRADDVPRYRCTEGLLIVERLSSTQRKITCGGDAVPALLR